jgi:DNA-binding response OmpR family regulator
VATVDLLISGGRGLELCRRLSAQADVPVVATSALDLRDAALEAGASAFLLKPIEPLRLVSTVRDLLSRSASLGRSALRGRNAFGADGAFGGGGALLGRGTATT